MTTKVKTPLLILLLIFCVAGCSEEAEQILQSEVQPAVPPAVSENGMSSDGVPAGPIRHGPMTLRGDLPEPLMCIEWHDLSQAQRNQKILKQAYAELLSHGGSCKVWVDNLVQNVSNGEVDLPPNAATLDRWIDDPERTDSEYCIGRRTSITTARPGEIVQLRWKTSYAPEPRNLHTLIVVSVNSSTLTFIDSNWDHNGEVGKRDLSIAEFNTNVDSFTIYSIQ